MRHILTTVVLIAATGALVVAGAILLEVYQRNGISPEFASGIATSGPVVVTIQNNSKGTARSIRIDFGIAQGDYAYCYSASLDKDFRPDKEMGSSSSGVIDAVIPPFQKLG